MKSRKANEVIISDPMGFVGNNAIVDYVRQIMDYITNIDTALSVANASTEVEFEY